MSNSHPKVGRTVWNHALDDAEEEIEGFWEQLRNLRSQRTDPELVLERITEIQEHLLKIERNLNTIREIGDHYKEAGL